MKQTNKLESEQLKRKTLQIACFLAVLYDALAAKKITSGNCTRLNNNEKNKYRFPRVSAGSRY